MNKRDAIQFIATSALLVGAGSLISACSEAKPQFKAVDITGADYAKDFQLTDHNGQPRSLKDFKG
ncbi:MAG: SCO family protein, partial [Burkholderiaceae bacterium]